MNILRHTMGLSEMVHRVCVIVRGSKERIEKEQSAVRKRASERVFRAYDPAVHLHAEEEAECDTDENACEMTFDLFESIANDSESPQPKPPVLMIDDMKKDEDFLLKPAIGPDDFDGDSQTFDANISRISPSVPGAKYLAGKDERLKIHEPDTAENLDYLLEDGRNADAVFRDEEFLNELFPEDEMETIIDRILATRINTQDTVAAA